MDIQKLINDYASWIKDEITFEKVGEYYEITTPFVDNANDCLQLYVKQEGNELSFSDDSATIHNLKMSGIQFTGNRRQQLQRILFQYGIQLKGEELTAKAPVNSFAPFGHKKRMAYNFLFHALLRCHFKLLPNIRFYLPRVV